MMTTEEAVLTLRADPAWAAHMRDSYLDENVEGAARRFESSAELMEVKELIGRPLSDATVLDLGAGTGIASHALARAGARSVVALEPDPSEVVGQGAVRRACRGLGNVHLASGLGEALPFSTGTFDVVYARQVLHHARDLRGLVAECARVLRPGGLFLACREHVVDDERQLKEFLRSHPIHQLAGGEHAFGLHEYQEAIRAAGLELRMTLGPWESIVNAFPVARSKAELAGHARQLLSERFGALGRAAARIPGVEAMVWRHIGHDPGRLYTFVGTRR